MLTTKKMVCAAMAAIMLVGCGANSGSGAEEAQLLEQIVDGGSYAVGDKVSKELLLQEMNNVQVFLETIHPMPYGPYTRDEYQKQVKIIADGLEDSIEYNDAVKAIYDQLKLTGDNNLFLVEDERLPINFVWNNYGLWVSDGTEYINRGDKVVSLNGVSVDEIQNALSLNNEYLTVEKTKGAQQLIKKSVLEDIGVLEIGENLVTIEVIEDTGIKKKEIVSLSNEPTVKEENTYNISGITAVLTLNDLDYTKEYSDLLNTFFSEAINSSVRTVIIDVSNSQGGEYNSIKDIMRYIGGDKKQEEYKIDSKESEYEIAEYSQDLYNEESSVVYEKNIEVITSNNTRGVGAHIGAAIQDNNLGVVKGDYAGEAPSGYINPVVVETPILDLSVSIPTMAVQRPNDNATSVMLIPDEYVTEAPEGNFLDSILGN